MGTIINIFYAWSDTHLVDFLKLLPVISRTTQSPAFYSIYITVRAHNVDSNINTCDCLSLTLVLNVKYLGVTIELLLI